MATSDEQIKQAKLELAEKVERRRQKVGQDSEGAKWGFNPQWRSAVQESFTFTYGGPSAAELAEMEKFWAEVTAEVERIEGTVKPGEKDQSKDLSTSATVGKPAKSKTVCRSELRRGGSVNVKTFAPHVADLNGHKEALAYGAMRIAGRMPSARDLLGVTF